MKYTICIVSIYTAVTGNNLESPTLYNTGECPQDSKKNFCKEIE